MPALVRWSRRTDKTFLEWQDGDHCIYNHSHEKNVAVADWFIDRLSIFLIGNFDDGERNQRPRCFSHRRRALLGPVAYPDERSQYAIPERVRTASQRRRRVGSPVGPQQTNWTIGLMLFGASVVAAVQIGKPVVALPAISAELRLSLVTAAAGRPDQLIGAVAGVFIGSWCGPVRAPPLDTCRTRPTRHHAALQVPPRPVRPCCDQPVR